MRRKYITSILISIMITVGCGFVEASQYPDIRNVEYIRNYDGDTITVDIKNYPDIIGKSILIRVSGVDTPEIRGECDTEKEWAVMSKEFVENELTRAKRIDILSPERGKYFRIIGNVVYDGKSLTEELIKGGYGVPYDGGTKVNHWCD